MGIQYFYKSQIDGSIWEEVTSQISIHISGNNVINNLPSNFEFTLSPFKKNISGIGTISSGIDVNIGDSFCVIKNDSEVIAFGKVFDPGRKVLSWDRKNNKASVIFNIKCYESDFSSYPIDKFDYTDTPISSILAEIGLYTDESLGITDIGKFKLNIEDYNIAFSLEQKSAREALTELCDQINCFGISKKSKIPDDIEGFKIVRYIDICDISGIKPDLDSSWIDGLSNKHMRDGVIQNPITENISSIPIVAAERDFKIEVDPSVIINYLDLSCKVYSEDSNSTYERFDQPALPDKFDYELNGYADDIKYIAMLIKTDILSGSTSSTVKVPSNMSADDIISVGDKVYFPANLDPYEESSFFSVASINKVNNQITEINFSPSLPFTPTVGKGNFEVISNLEIFRSQNDINYASKGVLIDCNKANYAKLKFLPLSEPPSGQIITCIYSKVIDYTYTDINTESISKYDLKYKAIKIDDSVTLTRAEVQNLASKILTLKPAYKFSVSSFRYDFVPVGLSISVRINNFITENFILNENNYQFLGNNDKNKQPLFTQNLVFSTEIGKPEKLIEKLQRQKKRITTNAESLNKNKQIESVKVQEYITWGFKPLSGIEDTTYTPPSPTIDSFSDITSDGFTLHYTPQTGIAGYRIDVSTNSSFSSFVMGYTDLGIGRSGSKIVNGLSYTGSSTIYVRMRSQTYDGISANSITYTVNLSSSKTNIFPTSITGSWGTLSLNYGYIFSPQSSGDISDKSSNSNTVSLERRYSSDNYPSWVQDSGIWGLDFTNADYSGLKINHSSSLILSDNEFTEIAIIKLNNTSETAIYRVIACKFSLLDSMRNGENLFYFQDQTITKHVIGSGSTYYDYIYQTDNNLTDSNLNAYSNSLKTLGTDERNIIKNQNSYSNTANLIPTPPRVNDLDNLHQGTNDLILGTDFYDGSWAGNGLKGKLFGYALIKKALTADQIKELHRVMGF